MSSTIPTHKATQKSASTFSHCKVATNIGIAMIMSLAALSTVGCSTTQEFKPTASVIVGGHKSI